MRVGLARPSVIALAIVLSGCGSAALRAAEHGDAAKLRAEIEDQHRRGKINNAEGGRLAHAVAAREIRGAKNDKDLLARLDETRGCAVELDDVLSERMEKHDGAGAEAALSRLDAGKLSYGTARDWLGDGDDRWRAVGTRALVRSGDGPRRRQAMVDPSPRVRKSALAASAEAQDPADLDVLFETARLDPELLLRNDAIRATSRILRKDGARAAEAATRLSDLWNGGDDAVREDVAVAWALSPVFENGGRSALRLAVASDRGPGAIAAAGVVTRTAPADKELVDLASGLLARTILEGSKRDRVHAIFTVRPTGAALEALRKVAGDDDRELRVAALGKLLDSAPDRGRATKELEAMAGYGVKGSKGGSDDPSLREQAARARMALAQVGDVHIQAWIEEDLASDRPGRRLGAASALAALGRSGRAAPLLTDADASVRTRAACTMMVGARR